MAKKKEIIETVVEIAVDSVGVQDVVKILPITQEFGNGDLNTLRDKINEIINR